MIFAGSLHSGRIDDPLFDAVERAQLSDLLAELGLEAPTLLNPWTTCRPARQHRVRHLVAAVLLSAWGRRVVRSGSPCRVR